MTVVAEISEDDLQARVKEFLAEHNPTTLDQLEFRGAQFDAGLAHVNYPEGLGGLGLSPKLQLVVDDMLKTAGSAYHNLRLNPVGIGMVGPTILTHGTLEQQKRFLRPMFTGEEVWCQLFSEPGAGSDLAGMSTTASLDGDVWRVNGQKVWNSLAHVAAFGVLVARTNPDLAKHQGLSYFLVDMTLPGIDARPLFQMTGVSEFNEVFLTDVQVPAAALLGQVGDGWKIAKTTLAYERSVLSGGGGGRGGGPVRTLLNLWGRRRGSLSEDERKIRRHTLAEIWIRTEVVRLHSLRTKSVLQSGGSDSYSSIGKLMWTELHQRIYDFCTDLEGAHGMLHEAGYPMTRASRLSSTPSISSQFLRARASTLEGGTSEILRNIIGEQLLGLPREVRSDAGVPWRELVQAQERS